MRAVRGLYRRVVVIALVASLVGEPVMLPASAIVAALADELQVATESLEGARRAQRCRHLTLQPRFGNRARPTGGLFYTEAVGLGGGNLFIVATTAADDGRRANHTQR